MNAMRNGWTITMLCLLAIATKGISQQRIVVAKDGTGEFTTITEALNSLPDSGAVERTIFIKKGVYNEKLFIKKGNLKLMGEQREATIITASISRDAWRCQHPDDWGVATLNVGANDITLQNLTITNRFGFDLAADSTIDCPNDTVKHKKKLGKSGHQMALRTMYSTRLKAINVWFKSFGGDTVSPWEVENGLWYFKDCVMEGGVDFYCPRGWAWAENCEFIAHNGPAAIWHDGSKYEDSKTVLKNCRFTGYDGFMLGRYHRDAQFYLVDCVFANNMKDQPIYRVDNGSPLQWGHRVYYYNCSRPAGNYQWFANNMSSLAAGELTIEAVFKGKWKPDEL